MLKLFSKSHLFSSCISSNDFNFHVENLMIYFIFMLDYQIENNLIINNYSLVSIYYCVSLLFKLR